MIQSKCYTDLIAANEVYSVPASELRMLDCRSDLLDKDYGISAYLESHIDGSDYLSIEEHLSAEPGISGRHPLPKIEKWVETIQEFGINNSTQVVLYDDSGGCYATRAWWMFRWVGHLKVAVLDGGWDIWDGPKSSITRPP